MFSPFVKGKQYFIKTVTFYYIATYTGKNKGFYQFSNVKWLENIPDWQEFVAERPFIPSDIKSHTTPDININKAAIVDFSQW